MVLYQVGASRIIAVCTHDMFRWLLSHSAESKDLNRGSHALLSNHSKHLNYMKLMELQIIGVDCSLLLKRNENVSPHPLFAAACNPLVVLAMSCRCPSEQSPITEKTLKMFFELKGWCCLVCVSKHFSSLH